MSKSLASYERVCDLMTNLGHGDREMAAHFFFARGNALLRAGRAYEVEGVLHRALGYPLDNADGGRG